MLQVENGEVGGGLGWEDDDGGMGGGGAWVVGGEEVRAREGVNVLDANIRACSRTDVPAGMPIAQPALPFQGKSARMAPSSTC